MKPNSITLVRIDKQHQRKVSTVTVSKLMDKLKANVGNNELAMLRFRVKNADPYMNNKHESMHRIYASACLKKSDNGALVVKDYSDMLLLSTSAILEEKQLVKLKQVSKIVPFTLATFIGSSGQTLKIIARVTLPGKPRGENEAEMEQCYRKAYKVASAIYSSVLNVPVSPAGL